jgi:conjugative transfer signal peptidase TraF
MSVASDSTRPDVVVTHAPLLRLPMARQTPRDGGGPTPGRAGLEAGGDRAATRKRTRLWQPADQIIPPGRPPPRPPRDLTPCTGLFRLRIQSGGRAGGQKGLPRTPNVSNSYPPVYAQRHHRLPNAGTASCLPEYRSPTLPAKRRRPPVRTTVPVPTHGASPVERHNAIRMVRSIVRSLTIASVVVPAGIAGCRAAASRLTWNATESLPRGLYRLDPGRTITRGSVATFVVPSRLRPLVVERGYLPPSTTLLKRVVAVPRDRVCTDRHRYVVNDQLISPIAPTDTAGRPLPPPYPFCGRVPEGFAFVVGNGTSSLDSRYFGPLPIASLTVAVPLWTSS